MTQDLFGNRSLAGIARAVIEEHGGKVGHDDLVQGVRHVMTIAEFDEWVAASFRQAVIRAGKRSVTSSGEDAVYGTGDELVALRLFSVDDFETQARKLARQADASVGAVLRLAEACEAIHGRTFDVEAVLATVDARAKAS